MDNFDDWVDNSAEEILAGEIFEQPYQRVDNSDDTSEVIGAVDEYFNIGVSDE